MAKLCEEYGVKKQTVHNTKKCKEKLKASGIKFGVVHKRKHMKVPKTKELEDAVYKWYMQQKSVTVNVHGLEILEATHKLANNLAITSFKGSTGWLYQFHSRVEHGKAACVDTSAVEPFRVEFNQLIKDKDLHLGQIYNADETALFWQSLPRNTKAFKNED